MTKNINRANGKKQDSAAENGNLIKIRKPTRSGNITGCAEVELGRQQRLGVLSLLQKLEQAKQAPKADPVPENVEYYIGVDIGDKKSDYCILDKNTTIAATGKLATTTTEFGSHFRAIPRSRIALEVGTHSPWISALLEGIGHEVFVANPRKMGGGKKKTRQKNDKIDAETLARQAKSDPKLLYPIRHRGEEARHALVLLRARQTLVRARSRLICGVRGLVKSDGHRLPGCSAQSFHRMEQTHVPEALRETLEPIFEQIGMLTKQIHKYTADVERMGRHAYPETDILRQVDGVGPVTSLAYILTIENPGRFAKSRDVGAYTGLVPRMFDSGDSHPQLRITKTGDKMLRELLVECAQHMLSRHGKDSDLRRMGLKLAARGGKNAKKRAVVAVARKTAILLHRLWSTGEVYEPLRNSQRNEHVA